MKKFLFLLAFVAVLNVPAAPGQSAIWSVNSREDVLKGDSRGISIDHNGALTPAPKWTEIYRSSAFVWRQQQIKTECLLGTEAKDYFRLPPMNGFTVF